MFFLNFLKILLGSVYIYFFVNFPFFTYIMLDSCCNFCRMMVKCKIIDRNRYLPIWIAIRETYYKNNKIPNIRYLTMFLSSFLLFSLIFRHF